MSRQPISEISERQAHALGIIRVLIHRNPDFPPTLSEIAMHLDATKMAASRLLAQLDRKGYVIRQKGAKRSIRLTGKPLPNPAQKRKAA